MGDFCRYYWSLLEDKTDYSNQTKLQEQYEVRVLIDFSRTVKAATLIFISGCGSAISSAK